MFVYDMMLQNVEGVEDLMLETATPQRRVWQLALYTVHLSTGSSLMCKAIKSGTIRAYIADVAKFLSNQCGTDPRYFLTTDSAIASPIKSICDEAQRWEKQKDRREPFTMDMWHHVHDAAIGTDPTGITAALRDWFGLGLHVGSRAVEWSQDTGKGHIDSKVHRNIYNQPYAFCLGDITFFTSARRRVTMEDAMRLPPGAIVRAELTYRTQKNNDNDQKLLLVIGRHGNLISSIACLLSICARFVALAGFNYDIPIAIFRTAQGTIRNITSAESKALMRSTAAALYGLDPITDAAALKKWSSHSLRIGALVILFAAGFSETQMKDLLRWKSNAFMAYLRALGFMSLKQTNAISDAGVHPNFL
jgi:hypothetical protein